MSTANRIEELRQKFDENPRRYFAPLANEYRKAGDLTQAIALCREHLPKQPGHMSGYIVFGQALFEAKELDEAREVFEQALALDPENLIALRHLGDIALVKNRPSLARRWYERVLDADPRNDDIAAQLMTLANMSTPRGGIPAIAEDAPAAAPAATTPPVQAVSPVVELPPARFTPRNFEPIDIDMPSARSMPTPSYPPRAIEVPPIPTPDAALRAIEEFPTMPSVSESARPVADALSAFAAFDPAHTLEDEVVAEDAAAASAPSASRASAEPIDDDVLPWNEPVATHSSTDEQSSETGNANATNTASLDFEEGLVAPAWPDTQDLVARFETPVRSITPLGTPISTAALDAFGREQNEYEQASDAVAEASAEDSADRILAQLPDRMFASGAFASISPVSATPPSHHTVDVELVADSAAHAEAEANVESEHDGQPAEAAAHVEASVETQHEIQSAAAESHVVAHDEGQSPDFAVETAAPSFESAMLASEGNDVADDASQSVASDDDERGIADDFEPTSHAAHSAPQHEYGIQLVSAFDNAHEVPANEITDEVSVDSSVTVDDDSFTSEADAAAPYDRDPAEELPWIAAVEATTHVESGLGEPSFAEYETSGDAQAIADQFAESEDEDSIADQFAAALDDSAFESVPVPVFAVDSVPDELPHVEPSVVEASFAEASFAEASFAEASFAEASFADVIDDEILRSAEASPALDEPAPESFAEFVAETDDVNSFNRTPVFITPLSATPVGEIPVISSETIATPAFATPAIDQPAVEAPVAETPVSATPAFASAPIRPVMSPTPAIGSAAFVTETMAELLVSQGFTARAVEVYEELVRRRPYDPVLTSRLAELREFLATPPAAPTPRSATPISSEAVADTATPTPVMHQTPVSNATTRSLPYGTTPVYSTPVSATPVSPIAAYVTPRSATPVSVHPVSATPLSNTPISSAPIAPTPIAVQALDYDAEIPHRRTARQRFAELAGRRVPRRTPPRATAVVDEPADGLSSLFGTGASNTHDDVAARALADAFGPVTDGGPSLFEPELSTGAQRATPLGSAVIPTPQSQRAARSSATDFSFDRFFPDPATPGAAASTESTAPSSVSAEQPPQSGEDLAQFSAWLKGLANP